MVTEKEIHNRLLEALPYVAGDNDLEVDYFSNMDGCKETIEDGWYACEYYEQRGMSILIPELVNKPIVTDKELDESGLDVYEVFRHAPFEFYISG